MNRFAARVLAWFDDHGRKDLPWQQQVNPYRVWVSEIMLQQTQVQTVIPYYERFMQCFPDIASLATAAQDDVLSSWSGLGYYARARNLHKAAQDVVQKHRGEFPTGFDEVIALPGIGRSTAGAILSLATAERHAILDGNVKRVLARHEAIAGWPGKTSVQETLWESAERYTPQLRVAEYTQAMMDLGATLCMRSRPACERCPVSADCKARLSGRIGDFPGRKQKSVKPLKNTTMILVNVDGCLYLERRPESGIWGGLWSLPELGDRSVEDFCTEKLGTEVVATSHWKVLRHSFSHYDLDIQPIAVRARSSRGKVADAGAATWYAVNGQAPGGIAAPVKKLIDQLKKSENVTHD